MIAVLQRLDMIKKKLKMQEYHRKTIICHVIFHAVMTGDLAAGVDTKAGAGNIAISHLQARLK